MVGRRQVHSEVRQEQLDRPGAVGKGPQGTVGCGAGGCSGGAARGGLPGTGRRGRGSTARVLASRTPGTVLITKSPPARWARLQAQRGKYE